MFLKAVHLETHQRFKAVLNNTKRLLESENIQIEKRPHRKTDRKICRHRKKVLTTGLCFAYAATKIRRMKEDKPRFK